jgi:CheY-like chemotaxis protein
MQFAGAVLQGAHPRPEPEGAVFQAKPWPKPSHDEIVKRARLLVIDDHEFPYLAPFRDNGYQVEKWDDVEDLADLERGGFDLILLDLHGVGSEHSKDQGLGLLKHIRHDRPAQLVVAYSAAKWDLRYQPFLKLADAVLRKSDDFYEFKEEVDRLLDQRFALGFYVNRATAELPSETVHARRLERKMRRSMTSGDMQPLRHYLVKKGVEAVTVDRVIAIASAGMTAASLWMK